MPDVQELFDKWAKIQKGKEDSTAGSVLQRIGDELNILETLCRLGCDQIPGEAFDVRFLIKDRMRLLREMRERLDNA